MFRLDINWQGGAVYIDNGGSFTTEGEVNYIDNSAVRFSFRIMIPCPMFGDDAWVLRYSPGALPSGENE